MEDNFQKSIVKYFFIVLIMLLFVVFYVWQNVEVMKIKMEFRELVKLQKALIKDNDRLIYEIEKYKTMKSIEKFARDNGYGQLSPDEFVKIKVD